jgi:cell division protease FtsH
LLVSDETASKIDEEVLSIIKTCYQNAIDILEENKDKLHEAGQSIYWKKRLFLERSL